MSGVQVTILRAEVAYYYFSFSFRNELTPHASHSNEKLMQLFMKLAI